MSILSYKLIFSLWFHLIFWSFRRIFNFIYNLLYLFLLFESSYFIIYLVFSLLWWSVIVRLAIASLLSCWYWLISERTVHFLLFGVSGCTMASLEYISWRFTILDHLLLTPTVVASVWAPTELGLPYVAIWREYWGWLKLGIDLGLCVWVDYCVLEGIISKLARLASDDLLITQILVCVICIIFNWIILGWFKTVYFLEAEVIGAPIVYNRFLLSIMDYNTDIYATENG